MMQRDLMLGDNELESLFEAARDETYLPSEALIARIGLDADEIAQEYALSWTQLEEAKKPSLIERFLSGVGGWKGATGLATAAAVGVIAGFGAPNTVYRFSPNQWTSNETSDTEEVAGYVVDDLVPSFYDLAVEG